MKKFLFLIFAIFFSEILPAQNVGIATPTPQYPLDVNGRMRLRHTATLSSGSWYNRSDNTEGTFAGLKNDSTFGWWGPLLGSGWKINFDMLNTRIGIGTVPQYPLVFQSILGDKISFWAGDINPTNNHYGIGVQNFLLQMFVPGVSQSIVFGTGRSAAFTENFRFTGDGKFGIGINNPTASLHVNGSVNITDGTQGAGNVLVSDATGNAHWGELSKIYAVSNTAFVPEINIDYSTNVTGYASITAGPTAAHLSAALHLPDGVILDSAKYYYTDNAVGDNLSMFLRYMSHNVLSYGSPSLFTTSGNVSGIRTFVQSLAHTVNNETTSYDVTVFAAGGNWTGMGIRGVVIYYHYP
ncbi:MAG TPA: hypothetical protein VK498_08620 [Ferruginibacter sp.]|nr:hypothetical protein [Ferruginibacter sp.]